MTHDTGLQGLHPRRRRPDGEFPPARAAKSSCSDGACPHEAVPVPRRRAKISIADHTRLSRAAAEAARKLPGVKKVFIRSGIRFDYLLGRQERARFSQELVQLSHLRPAQGRAGALRPITVLGYMGKPPARGIRTVSREIPRAQRAATAMEQFVVPYLMSSHPGCTMEDAVALALNI